MRMKEPYEAYLDDYNCLDVYMSKKLLWRRKSHLPYEGYEESYYTFNDSIAM